MDDLLKPNEEMLSALAAELGLLSIMTVPETDTKTDEALSLPLLQPKRAPAA